MPVNNDANISGLPQSQRPVSKQSAPTTNDAGPAQYTVVPPKSYDSAAQSLKDIFTKNPTLRFKAGEYLISWDKESKSFIVSRNIGGEAHKVPELSNEKGVRQVLIYELGHDVKNMYGLNPVNEVLKSVTRENIGKTLILDLGEMVKNKDFRKNSFEYKYEERDPDFKTFEEAANSFAKGDYRSALKAFEGISPLRRDSSVLYNIATCYEKLGEHQKANEAYQLGLRSAKPEDVKDFEAGIARSEKQLKPGEQKTVIAQAKPAPTPPEKEGIKTETRQPTPVTAEPVKPKPIVIARREDPTKRDEPVPMEEPKPSIPTPPKTPVKVATPQPAPKPAPTPGKKMSAEARRYLAGLEAFKNRKRSDLGSGEIKIPTSFPKPEEEKVGGQGLASRDRDSVGEKNIIPLAGDLRKAIGPISDRTAAQKQDQGNADDSRAIMPKPIKIDTSNIRDMRRVLTFDAAHNIVKQKLVALLDKNVPAGGKVKVRISYDPILEHKDKKKIGYLENIELTIVESNLSDEKLEAIRKGLKKLDLSDINIYLKQSSRDGTNFLGSRIKQISYSR